MKLSFPSFVLATGLLASAASGLTIPSPTATEIAEIEKENNEAGGPYQFAVTHDVKINPCNKGEIIKNRWNLIVESPGAKHLNFGFENLKLSNGAKMIIRSVKGSDKDEIEVDTNKNASGQYWTRIIRGDEVNISIDFPEGIPDSSCGDINLGTIGVGFRGFSTEKSGGCNIDVVCPERIGWEKEIPSVAVYSKGGSLACTGVMINNMKQDGKPYFLTANHCGVNNGNAASVVTYWNYETSTCDGAPDGSLDQSLSGATEIKSSSTSDVTLLLLNDEPPREYGVTFAGWDSTPEAYDLPGVAIHHPSVDEKRISFEYDPMASTSYLGNSVSPSGTHVKVYDWDLGTTEPGSSGSPLFNGNNRIIGQLHGGYAACSNDSADWYGRFSRSWADNSEIRNALDPDDDLNGGEGGIDTYDPYAFPTVSPRPTSSPTGAPSSFPTVSLRPSASPTGTPTCGGSSFDLNLLTDWFGSETTWTLINLGTSTTVSSGGPYGNSQLYEEKVCINSGCYKFTMFDSFGDGLLCCGHGRGGYTVTVDGEIVLESNGDFAFEEETEFCTSDETCTDSDSSISPGQGNTFSCAQVALADDACSNDVPASHCPDSCNRCGDYACKDSEAPFSVFGNTITCSIVAGLGSQQEQACNEPIIFTTCRETCGFCLP